LLCYNNYMHKRLMRGFTMVELIIIISVISALASIVVVSYSTGKTRSNDVAVKQDLVKIADALNVYYSDNGSYPTNQAAFLTVTSAKVSIGNYASNGASAVLYCVDNAASNLGDSMAVIAKSASGNIFYIKDENQVTTYAGSFPGGGVVAMCTTANSSLITPLAVWIHLYSRADSAGVSSNGWLVNVL